MILKIRELVISYRLSMPLLEILPPQTKVPGVSSRYSIVNGKEVPFDLSTWTDGYAVLLFLTGSGHSVSEQMLASFSEVNVKD